MFLELLTGLFAQASIAALDGTTKIPGGWLDKNYIQLAWQLADSVTGLSYSFVMTVSDESVFIAAWQNADEVPLNELDGDSVDHALHPLLQAPHGRGL